MEKRILLVGLPAAGKTTFLAVLWYVLDMGRVEGGLRLTSVHGNQAYLNRIRDAWGRCEPAERTPRGDETLASVRLEALGGTSVELVLPDMSGEMFIEQWATGRCTRTYLNLANGADGILLFVNPDNVDQGLAIRTILETAAALGGPIVLDTQPKAPVSWKPDFAGTQVQLVEMLQMLQRRPFTPRRRRVGVIVSAWDRVEPLNVEPLGWLEERLPILHQYLLANPETYPFQVYGVSAQGGDFLTQRKELQAYVEAWQRIKVVGPEAKPCDITAPIRWLIQSHGSEHSDG